MSLYIRLRKLREEHDLSQQALADHLNIGQSSYSRYEMGECEIPACCLITLAHIYKTSTDYLLGLTDDPEPYPPRANGPMPPLSAIGRSPS